MARFWIDLENKYSHGQTFFHQTAEPTLIDIIVYGFIANFLSTKTNPFTTKQILSQPNLVKFAKLMTQKLFPEYHRILAILEGATNISVGDQPKYGTKEILGMFGKM